MGLTLTQEDVSWLDGPDGNRTWNTGTLIRLGFPQKYGWCTSNANSQGHTPAGGPYWPNVLNFTCSEGGTAGSVSWRPTMKSGPYTAGVLSHTFVLAASDVISAGNWTLRLDTPMQPNLNQEIIQVAVGTFYRNTADPGANPPINGDWSPGSQILVYTWPTPITLSQISAQSHSVTVPGSAVSLPAGKHGYFLYFSWIFKNGLGSTSTPLFYSKQTYDTQVSHASGRIVTLGARHVTEDRLILPTQGF